MAVATREKRKSLGELVSDVPRLVTELVQAEIELIKTEVIAKLKAVGIGAGLIVGALVVLLWFVGVLLTAAILGLATVMPGWLAALIVAAVLLIVIVVLVLLGIRSIKRALPPVPEKGIAGLKLDLEVVRGVATRHASFPATPPPAKKPEPEKQPQKEQS